MASVDEIDSEVITLLKHFTHRRISRVFMYLFLLASSVVSFFAPSEVFMDQASTGLSKVWSVVFCIAALICFVGSVLDRWIWEYIMLPLLATSMVVFGLGLLGSGVNNSEGIVVPYAMFFGAFSCGLFARWRDVQSLLRAAVSLGANK